MYMDIANYTLSMRCLLGTVIKPYHIDLKSTAIIRDNLKGNVARKNLDVNMFKLN